MKTTRGRRNRRYQAESRGRQEHADLDSIHRERQRVEVLDRELVPPTSGDLCANTADLFAHARLVFLVPGQLVE